MEKQINWEQIHLSHDLLFGQVMQEPTLCKIMLEKLLGFSIESISYPEPQKTLDIALHTKGIRMDIYVKDGSGTKVYTVEMQTRNHRILGKRSRYYQSLADLTLLKKGEFYDALPVHYVIFICTFDPFGKGRYQYSFENLCKEDTSLCLKDGTYKLFFNTKGRIDDVSEDVKKFLRYFDGELSDDPYVRQLDERVQAIKNNEEWREYYMTFGQLLKEEYQYGIEQGIEQGKLESARALLLRGNTYEFVSNTLGISVEKIKSYMEQNVGVTL